MPRKDSNFPFDQVVTAAEELARQGLECHQKFTCAKCGQRLTMDEINQFFETGSCDQCGHITDIKKDGCNYMVVSREPASLDRLGAIFRPSRKGPRR